MSNYGFDDFYENGCAPSIEEMRKQFEERLYGKKEDREMKVILDPMQDDLANKIIEDAKNGRATILPRINENNQPNPKVLDDKCSDGGWINTYSGKKFFPLNPKEEDIDIEDAASALSMLCRFTGHVKEFYSVAQHSVIVSMLCTEVDAKHGLLHDLSEAYLQDLPSPLKRSGKFEAYKEYEKNLQTMIYRKFGLNEVEPSSVKNADLLALATEASSLFKETHKDWKLPCRPLPMKIIALSPSEAKSLFLERYKELFDQK